MKTNSCYSLFIILLATFPLSGMQGPVKAIQKKSTKPQLTPANLISYFAQVPADRLSLTELNALRVKSDNQRKLLKTKNTKLVESLDHTFTDPNKTHEAQTALPTQLNPLQIVQLISENDVSFERLKAVVLQCNPLELLLATIKGKQPTALKKLLDHNLVNPHQKLVNGQTVLHIATQISDLPIELLEILLKHTQQSISLLDGNDAFPIDNTIENMNLALTKILIEHNSPIGKHSIIGAVVYANESNKDHLEIITLLCEKYPSFIDEITQLFNDMETPLIAAIVLNKIKIVELLLNKGANPNFKDTSLMTPLLNAVYYNIHSIPLLIQYGANIRTTAEKDEHGLFLKEGMTPADYAQELFNKGVNDEEWFDSVLKYLNPLHTLITHIENLHIEEKHINEEKNEDKMETD